MVVTLTPEAIAVAETREGTRVVLTLTGELTAFTCHHLSSAVNAAIGTGAESLDLRLDDVDFVDSSGLQCLLQVRWLADDAHVALSITVGERVRGVLDIKGITTYLMAQRQ